MSNTRNIAIAAASVAVIASVTFYALTMRRNDPFRECRSGALAGATGSIGGPFTLVNQEGVTVTDREVLQKPSLVYFGYTSCPDVCPTDMARNAEAVDAIEEMGFEVVPVFISVDPKRDTPPVLKEWTSLMHPRMVGLTGTTEQIDQAAKAFRTFYSLPADISGDDYAVEHMTQTYLMLPKVGFVDFFTRDADAATIAERTACFLTKAG